MTGRVTRYLGRHHWGILATFIALGGTSYAVSSGAQSNVHGCVDRRTGAVRIATRCQRGERDLTWAKSGPVGPVGPSDGYYATTSSPFGVPSLKLPPGDYIATGGCTAGLTQTASESPTVPTFGEALSLLTTNRFALTPASAGPSARG